MHRVGSSQSLTVGRGTDGSGQITTAQADHRKRSAGSASVFEQPAAIPVVIDDRRPVG